MTVSQTRRPQVKLGVMPLTDCALIVIAKERGIFEKHGVDVTLSREPSWANLRDKIMVGELDGAHMLAPMLFAATLGIGAPAFPMNTAFSLGLNGNAITVSNALYEEMVQADPTCATMRPMPATPLGAVIAARKKTGKPLLTFAMVFSFALHNYQIRYWLANAGIHPDRDVRLIVIPPPQMAGELAAGTIDGFCSGGPWNQAAVMAGLGRVAITGYEIWNNGPEKVLGVSQAWAHTNPDTYLALVRALIETAQWLDNPDNVPEAARIIGNGYVNVDAKIIAASILGEYRYDFDRAIVNIPNFHVFHRLQANFPWVSHAVWVLSQMYRWGHLTEPVDIMRVAQSVYRPDIYRQAAAAFGLPTPSVDMKSEGLHSEPWMMDGVHLGSDKFVDGRPFDPVRPVSYLEGFDVHNLRLPPETIAAAMDTGDK